MTLWVGHRERLVRPLAAQRTPGRMMMMRRAMKIGSRKIRPTLALILIFEGSRACVVRGRLGVWCAGTRFERVL